MAFNMSSSAKHFVVLLLSAVCMFEVDGGGIHLALCHIACETVFVGCIAAAGAGSAGVAIPAAAIPCYTACTACYITCGIAGAPSCLDGTNLVNTSTGVKQVSEVAQGDFIATINDNGLTEYTRVRGNTLNHGLVDFIEITLDDGKAFNVTYNHIVAVERSAGNVEIDQAEHVKLGDTLVTSTGHAKASIIRRLQQNSRWTLSTKAGSMLVNGVLVTGICADDFEVLPKNFWDALVAWRLQHHGITEKILPSHLQRLHPVALHPEHEFVADNSSQTEVV